MPKNRKSRSKSKPNPAEDALRRYCDSSVVKEYDEMQDAGQRKVFLEALTTGCRSRVLQRMMQEQRSGQGMSRKPKADPSCPLVRALAVMGADTHNMLEEHFEFCRDVLSTWGVPETSPMHQIMRYTRIVELQKSSPTYKDSNSGGMHSLRQTNRAVIKSGQSNKDWSRLQKTRVRDLKLFLVSKGCYVEGTIVAEAVQPMVGGTTMIMDESGDVLLICFYNFLPDDISGADAEPLLREKFPLGAKVKVAEPFLKVFGDGQRGVRLDDPMEMVIDVSTCFDPKQKGGGSSESAEMESNSVAAKKQGNSFVAKRRYYAASEAYLGGIRGHELVTAILSNRCQALIGIGRYSEAFLDAAAALTMAKPGSKLSQKSWSRYDLCLEKIQKTTDADTKANRCSLFESLLPAMQSPEQQITSKQVQPIKGDELKAAGNKAFQTKNYGEAVKFYSEALAEAGETVRAMLSNWALCGLETMALGDVIAATLASVRIGLDEKAIYRLAKAFAYLGEYELAHKIIWVVMAGNKREQYANLAELASQIDTAADMVRTFDGSVPPSPLTAWTLVADTPSLLGNWCGPVETFMTSGKGRGLRAKRTIEEGFIIVCERSPVSTSVDSKDGQDFVACYGQDNRVDDTTSTKFLSSLMLRLQHDAVLSRIMDRLSDGKTIDKPLIPLDELLVCFDMFPLCLPGRREYMSRNGARIPDHSFETVQNIVSTNTHGSRGKDFASGSTELLPAISMMNHSRKPNCRFLTTEKSDSIKIVAAARSIVPGEELTIRYHTDEVVAWKWGIIA